MAKKLLPLAGERQKGESSKAVQACNDYLRMGPGRSLADLHRRYTKSNQQSPPTEYLGTLKKWSSRFDWAKRAELYDVQVEERKTAERNRIMNEGLALDFERVKKLDRLAGFLEEQLYLRVGEDGRPLDEETEGGTFPNVWLPDVKQIGGGEHAERVDIVRFNAAIISEFRGVLDDLAKETGGRVQKQEVSGDKEKPLEHKVKFDLSDIPFEVLAGLASGDGPPAPEGSTESS